MRRESFLAKIINESIVLSVRKDLQGDYGQIDVLRNISRLMQARKQLEVRRDKEEPEGFRDCPRRRGFQVSCLAEHGCKRAPRSPFSDASMLKRATS